MLYKSKRFTSHVICLHDVLTDCVLEVKNINNSDHVEHIFDLLTSDDETNAKLSKTFRVYQINLKLMRPESLSDETVENINRYNMYFELFVNIHKRIEQRLADALYAIMDNVERQFYTMKRIIFESFDELGTVCKSCATGCDIRQWYELFVDRSVIRYE